MANTCKYYTVDLKWRKLIGRSIKKEQNKIWDDTELVKVSSDHLKKSRGIHEVLSFCASNNWDQMGEQLQMFQVKKKFL